MFALPGQDESLDSRRQSRIWQSSNEVQIKSKAADKSVRPTHTGCQARSKSRTSALLVPFTTRLLFVTDRGAVALVQVLAVQFDCAFGDLQPGVTALAQLVLHFLPGSSRET